LSDNQPIITPIALLENTKVNNDRQNTLPEPLQSIIDTAAV
jgi:hypothetical protein